VVERANKVLFILNSSARQIKRDYRERGESRAMGNPGAKICTTSTGGDIMLGTIRDSLLWSKVFPVYRGIRRALRHDNSIIICAFFITKGKYLWVYSVGLIFVSVRTNKRPHHPPFLLRGRWQEVENVSVSVIATACTDGIGLPRTEGDKSRGVSDPDLLSVFLRMRAGE